MLKLGHLARFEWHITKANSHIQLHLTHDHTQDDNSKAYFHSYNMLPTHYRKYILQSINTLANKSDIRHIWMYFFDLFLLQLGLQDPFQG